MYSMSPQYACLVVCRGFVLTVYRYPLAALAYGALQHLEAKAESFHPSRARSFYGLLQNKVREHTTCTNIVWRYAAEVCVDN